MSGAQTIHNPNGAFGYTDLQNKLFHIEGEFKASAAIAARHVVGIGTDGRIVTQITNGTPSLVVGVAREAIASGDTGGVIVGGVAEDVPCTGTVAAGALLIPSGTTAGYVAASATPAAGAVVGVAINASASNTVDVWVYRR